MSGFLGTVGLRLSAGVYYDQYNNTILASKNVASITDNATGSYRINYATALNTKNKYHVSGAATENVVIGPETTTSCSINTSDDTGTARDVRSSIMVVDA